MRYYLYILYSNAGDRYYIGSSDDPKRRLNKHNTIEKGFTSRYRPWDVVFIKEYPDKKFAQKAERKLKSWKSREMIERVISGTTEI